MSFYHTNPEDHEISYASSEDIKKAFLGFDYTNIADEDLDILAESASRMIDDYTNQIFFQQQIIQEKHNIVQDHLGRLAVRLHYHPIIEINDVFIEILPGQTYPIQQNFIDLHHQQGFYYVYTTQYSWFGRQIDLRAPNISVGTIVTSYTAGPKKVPSPIKRATCMLVRNLLNPGGLLAGISGDQTTNANPIKKIDSKSYSEEYDTEGGGNSGIKRTLKPEDDLLFTSDVKAMLRPYIRRGVL